MYTTGQTLKVHHNHDSFRCCFRVRGRHLNALACHGSSDGWPSPGGLGAQMQPENIVFDWAAAYGGGTRMLAVYWLSSFGLSWIPIGSIF